MISAVILTKNEEKNILDCLESVSWVDEIVIVDDYSTDLTEQVVKNFTQNKKIKFFKRRLEEDFSAQRNFGLLKATYSWVLFLDADERVTKELKDEINNILINNSNEDNVKGYLMPRIDVLWGKKMLHGETGKIKLLRLGKKESGKWVGKVHEVWNINSPVGELDQGLIHFPHQSVGEFLKEINFYTDIRAKELFNSKRKVVFWEILLYPKGKFIVNYFFKLGFLDGIEGMVFAIIMSFHSFLVRAKLWTLWKND